MTDPLYDIAVFLGIKFTIRLEGRYTTVQGVTANEIYRICLLPSTATDKVMVWCRNSKRYFLEIEDSIDAPFIPIVLYPITVSPALYQDIVDTVNQQMDVDEEKQNLEKEPEEEEEEEESAMINSWDWIFRVNIGTSE